MLQNTMAQVALEGTDERSQAPRDTTTSGRATRLVGRRMPDLDLSAARGPTRVFSSLYDARPVLLNFDHPGGFDLSPWADRIRSVGARAIRRTKRWEGGTSCAG